MGGAVQEEIVGRKHPQPSLYFSESSAAVSGNQLVGEGNDVGWLIIDPEITMSANKRHGPRLAGEVVEPRGCIYRIAIESRFHPTKNRTGVDPALSSLQAGRLGGQTGPPHLYS